MAQSARVNRHPNLQDLVAQILDEARRQGASQAEASVNQGRGLSVTVRLGEVETIEHHQDKGLGVTVYFGQSKGHASTSDFSPQAIRETVRAASAIARHTAADPFAGLADPALLARDLPDLDLYHPWDISADQAIEVARECEAAARAHDSRIVNSEGASLGSGEGLSVYANSNGFLGSYRSSRHNLSCSVIARDEQGNMQRDYWYDVARQASALASPAAIGKRAAERTVRRLNARKLGTRMAPVLFENQVAASLLSHFASAISGSNLYRRTSFLMDAVGQPVFADGIRIYEEPLRVRGLGSAPFDGEGVATRNRDLIKDGVLQDYLLDSYSARKLGLASTGNAGGAHNLTLEPGQADFQDLLKTLDQGLLVTELIGFGVNNVTGDYSRGAAGFWVEGGEIRYPVEEITIAGNLKAIYRSIVAVGADMLIHGNVGSPSLLIGEMTIAGS